jgi:gluconolactonase
MRQKVRFAIALGMLAAVTWSGRTHSQTPGPAVQLIAPDIPGVIAKGTRVELVRGGLAGADDPIAVPGVGLVFSEPDASRVVVLDANNRITTLVEQSNESHGMTLDARGRLISAQSRDRQTRIGVIYPKGQEALLADNLEGRPFSRPNDVIVDRKGGELFRIAMLAQGFMGRAK